MGPVRNHPYIAYERTSAI